MYHIQGVSVLARASLVTDSAFSLEEGIYNQKC